MQLNAFLQPLDSPVTSNNNFTTGYDFISNNERGALISQSMFGTAVIGELNIQDASITDAKIDTVAAGKITAGTVTVALDVGASNVKIDGANNRIVINDGTNDRVLLGYQSGGF